MKEIAHSIATFLGNRSGRIVHVFKGCSPFWTYVKNSEGKFKTRICHWCGKREDRRHGGKWKYIGRYKK